MLRALLLRRSSSGDLGRSLRCSVIQTVMGELPVWYSNGVSRYPLRRNAMLPWL